MSDTEAPKGKANSGWNDKERLTYLFALIENSNIKFDYANTPRPAGRSIIACQRMMDRLKGTLKIELEALKSGQPIEEGTPKKAAGTPKKRKAKESEEAATPSKRARKKKNEPEVPVDDEEVLEESKVKPEPKEDEFGLEDEM